MVTGNSDVILERLRYNPASLANPPNLPASTVSMEDIMVSMEHSVTDNQALNDLINQADDYINMIGVEAARAEVMSYSKQSNYFWRLN